MPGFIDLGFDLIKDGVERYGLARANPYGNPIFKPGAVEPHYSEYLMFEGICVEHGRNYYMDATVAYHGGIVDIPNCGLSGAARRRVDRAQAGDGSIGDLPSGARLDRGGRPLLARSATGGRRPWQLGH